MRDLILWDAVIAWRDIVLESDFFIKKKTEILSNMTKLIESGVIDLEQSLSDFIKIGLENSLREVRKFSNWPGSTQRARCSLLKSIHKIATEEKIKRTNIEIPFKSLKEAKKNVISEILSSNADKSKLLKESEIVRFTKELCDINARDSLVCWMMWEFQCTIHEILSITINDIDLSKNILKDKKNNFLGEIRQDLKPCILAQKKDKTGTDFLFTTREGKTMHASQIVRNMKIASQRAKLPFIYSPKLLYADAKAYARRTFLSLPEEERTRLCLKMATKN